MGCLLMIKVKNEKIKLKLFEKGKLIKEVEFHNRLTDLYLDYVLYKTIGSTLGDTLYPEFASYTDLTYIPFSYSYVRFNTDQVLTDASTTMVYNEVSSSLTTGDIIFITEQKKKIFTTNYSFAYGNFNYWETLYKIGFGRYIDETSYLFSYIDLQLLDLAKIGDMSFQISRYDEISSTEIKITSTELADYLPFGAYTGDKYGELDKIGICFGGTGKGDGDIVSYNLSDLTLTRGTAGVLDVTGFADFHIENYSNLLQPSVTLQPSETLQPTQGYTQFNSVKFTYNIYDGLTLTGTQETYIRKEDLDMSYEGTEIKIRLKCERGEY